jgi:hypothetical protein
VPSLRMDSEQPKSMRTCTCKSPNVQQMSRAASMKDPTTMGRYHALSATSYLLHTGRADRLRPRSARAQALTCSRPAWSRQREAALQRGAHTAHGRACAGQSSTWGGAGRTRGCPVADLLPALELAEEDDTPQTGHHEAALRRRCRVSPLPPACILRGAGPAGRAPGRSGSRSRTPPGGSPPPGCSGCCRCSCGPGRAEPVSRRAGTACRARRPDAGARTRRRRRRCRAARPPSAAGPRAHARPQVVRRSQWAR